ncbi:nucleotidyltransferase domain-containing protein [Streptosporangium amethystogenes]|uniref:nucleotidyltransferase domain-containing protein n=1 Tax=Streptosporangium amethystogenes TaxID=2002 RepID=UPI00378C5D5B
MHVRDVVEIVSGLEAAGVAVWVDGGWCVDALVGRQTRDHDDLDIAIGRGDEQSLRDWFHARGYLGVARSDRSPWNFVLGSTGGRLVDVHVFEFDEQGELVYGVEYPKDSLTGSAVLGGVTVRCIAPEWMFRFKTSYPPAQKDRADVRALHEKYGFEIPPGRRFLGP